MSLLPLKTAISDFYPAPDNNTARVGFAALWDAVNEATEKPELDLASAATIDLGGQLSTKLRITGTTGPITSFGTTYRGPIFGRFQSALAITHNATTLILPGGANLTTSAGGTFIAVPKATTSGTHDGWIVVYSSDYIAAQLVLKAASGANNDITSLGALTTSLAGLRNRIINGDMRIDQRNSGAAQTFTAAAALAYCVDRWYGYCTGANVTGQRTTASSGKKTYQFSGAASVTAVGFGQRIERENCSDLFGATATLSVDLACQLATVAWTAYYSNSAGDFGTLAVPTRTQIATGTFTVSGTLTRYSASINIPVATTSAGIEIVFTVGALTSGTWQIGNVQLEPGPAATVFERRPIGLEMALCKRFCQKIQWSARITATAASQYLQNGQTFPVEMFAVPTVTNFAAGSAANVTGIVFSASTAAGGRGEATSVAAGDASVLDRIELLTAEMP